MTHSLQATAPAFAHNDLVVIAFLATAFIVIFGAMVTPIVLAATRPIHPTVEQLARRAAVSAFHVALARVLRWGVAVATAGTALSLLVAVFVTPVEARSPHDASQTATTKSIERMIGILNKVAKHPVVQGAKIIARSYTAVKVYNLSKDVKGLKVDVAALHASVHAVLTEVTSVVARIEAGEQLTAEALAAVDARIDMHAIQIAAAEAEIEVLRHRMDAAERKQRVTDALVAKQQKRITRDAKTPYHYFDPKCQCRRDKREIASGSGLLDVKAQR